MALPASATGTLQRAVFVDDFEADLDCDGSISVSGQLTMLAKIRTYELPGPSGLACAEILCPWARCSVVEKPKPGLEGRLLFVVLP